MSHGSAQQDFDDCESHGPRPRVPGQETRIYQMSEGPPKGTVGAGMTLSADSCATVGAAAVGSSGIGSAGGAGVTSASLTSASDPSASASATKHSGIGAHHAVGASGFCTPTHFGASETNFNSHIANRQWHDTLIRMLDDSRCAELFKRYVEQHGGIHSDRLNFYFACEGLKQETEDAKIKQFVAAIYKFLRKSNITLGNELRARIKAGLAAGAPPMDANIFNAMQMEIVQTIHETTYPHFLQSDLYIQHLNATAATATTPSSAPTPAPPPPVPPSPYSKASAGFNEASSTTSATMQRTLMTLHEDSELSSCEPSGAMPLTLNSLLATEGPRLGVRPNGAHGYVGQFSSAYNPVSLQNSECMSVSSGGVQDADNRHRSAREGRPEHRRRSEDGVGSSGSLRCGPGSDMIIHHDTNLTVRNKQNINSGMRGAYPARRGAHPCELTPINFINRVLPQLEAIRVQQELISAPIALPSLEQSLMNVNGYSAALKLVTTTEDDNQAILDNHCNRVWTDDKSPMLSPGTKSPYPYPSTRGSEMDFGGGGGGAGGSMRHPHTHGRSTTDRRQAAGGKSSSSSSAAMQHPVGGSGGNSGMFRTMEPTPMQKPRLESSASRSRSMVTEVACSNTLEEARRRLQDATRISRHYPQPYPQEAPLSPPPAQVNARTKNTTTAMYTFPGELVPYRYILPFRQLTLRQFKDNMPKKGNFRYFFTTDCDDPDTPVIQVEIVNDSDILPLFEGKVMGLAKRYE